MNASLRDRVWLYAVAGSLAVHCLAVAAVQTWGTRLSPSRKVVCPQFCRPSGPLVLELEALSVLPATKPLSNSPSLLAPDIKTPLVVHRPLAAPKRGNIALPKQVFTPDQEPLAGVKLDRPALPNNSVTPAAAAHPVEATPEVFDRATSLVASDAHASGLGGNGIATGAGPFGNDPAGSGLTGSGSGIAPQTSPASAVKLAPAATEKPTAMKSDPVTPSPATTKGETRPAKLVYQTTPVYPSEAQRRGREGSVLVRVTVQADGSVGEIVTITSSGENVLDEAVKREVRQWRFLPALREGQPVAQPMLVRVKFRIER